MSARPRTSLLSCALTVGLQLALVTNPVRAQETDTSTSLPSPYAWQGPVSDVERNLAACLRESRLAGEGSTPSLVTRMVSLERSTTPVIEGLLSILIQGRLPKVHDGDAPQKLSAPQRALALSALAALPDKEIRTALDARLAHGQAAEVQITAVNVLGTIGNRKDLVRLASLSPKDMTGQLTRESREAVRAAYARILARDTHAWGESREILKGKDPDCAQQMLLALADVRHAHGLELCYEVARSRPELAHTAVALVSKFARSNDVDLERDFADWLHASIDPSRREWCRAVYGALAVLDEGHAVPDLIKALDSDEIGLRDAALASLRSICAISLPADRARWEAWFTQEDKWFKSARPREKSNLASRAQADVISALRAYSNHRLYRNTLARDLLASLKHREASIRELTCATLAQLGSRVAARDLIETLDDPTPSVGKAAQAALQTIVGTKVPREAQTAREQLLSGL